MKTVLFFIFFTLLSKIHALDLTKLDYDTSSGFSIMTDTIYREMDRSESREDRARVIANALKRQNKLDNRFVVVDTLYQFWHSTSITPQYVGELVQDALIELQNPDAGRTITENMKKFTSVKRKFNEILPELFKPAKTLEEKIDLIAHTLKTLGEASNPEAINYAANRLFEIDDDVLLYDGRYKTLLKKALTE